jgi:signal transduction histidine kinase
MGAAATGQTFKSEILGTVAHDLKNPLGVILGRTEICRR